MQKKLAEEELTFEKENLFDNPDDNSSNDCPLPKHETGTGMWQTHSTDKNGLSPTFDFHGVLNKLKYYS